MKKIFVIGIGAGNPDYITVQAINALNAVDVFFILDKGQETEDLTRMRKDVCERYIKDKSYRTVEAADPPRAGTADFAPVVPARDQKGTRCVCASTSSRGCPRNCKRRAFDHHATGSFTAPGKAVEGGDPRARRSATGNGHARARRAGCPGVLKSGRLGPRQRRKRTVKRPKSR